MERGAGLPGGGVSRSGAQKVVLAGGEMPAASIKRSLEETVPPQKKRSLGEKVSPQKKRSLGRMLLLQKKRSLGEKVPPQKKRSRWRAAFFIV